MTSRLPALKPREVIRALERAGFSIHHVRGSHYYLKHPEKPRLLVTVPYHPRELYRSLLQSIIKQASLTTDEFRRLL